MKHFFLFLFLIPAAISAQYSSQNITKVGHWNDPGQISEPFYGIRYQGIWGWKDPDDGREYAILGSASGTFFVDVTDPANPVMRDFVKGRLDSCIWREVKTYQNYCYMVSDDDGSSFQIADMSYLPDSVHVVHDDFTIFGEAHTIFVDGDNLYAGIVTVPGNIVYRMAVYSLANPANPTLIRKLDDDYPSADFVHDMFVRNDTVYASSSYSGLFIYRLTASNTFTLIGQLTSYPEQGYNHSSSLTRDGKTLIFCDEVPADRSVKALDVSDLQNPTITDLFKSSPGATPHNPYVVGNDRVVVAYYADGVQIFDISDPSNVVRTGYFDTDTLCGTNNNFSCSTPYHGCWGAYTELPSGYLIASDMQNGLFVLDISQALGVSAPADFLNEVRIFPNPGDNDFRLEVKSSNSQDLTWQICDITGKILSSSETKIIPGSNIIPVTSPVTSGIYIVNVKTGNENISLKLVKN